MVSKRSASKGEKINPHFWVFCEGETEEAYVCFLRSKYRIPIEIVPKIVGNKITQRIIQNSKQGKPSHDKDKDFLMYDADVPEVLEKLKVIKTAVLIASNPSIELWFLLHYKNQTANIKTEDCIQQLSNRNRNTYKKGVVDSQLEIKLSEICTKACERAKELTLFDNPSSNMNVFIEELENVKRQFSKM
ncbi:MAG: RloB family protein [Bacteroidales bacterium]|nr:RloB family protein [Bacteroidales bacterium]MDD4218084.1 RloB family protein [Bacteroidales bacterium]MDY0143136.1 RloB family protein [Bacteroidales bacterium]